MAAALKVTGFHDAVDYKVVQCTGIDDTTKYLNVTGGSGTLYAAYLDLANSSTNLSLHIRDGRITSNSEICLRGSSTAIRSIQIPTGIAFSQLDFWISANSAEADTTSFSGVVSVTLICT